ncbi:MAG TPA: HPP family protein [Elusimicrobiota bacterium]|nr:HPP family protein [Elusimicrobiota bacterium]
MAPGLIERLRLPYLLKHYPSRVIWAFFVFVNGFITMAILGGVAVASKTPFIFPSLGPTALLLFFNPETRAASPRSTLCGHAIGIVCAYALLRLMGLTAEPPGIQTGVLHAQRVICASLSLVSTGVLMVLLDVWHPPAGATTLIVSLGIIARPYHLLVIELAVALLVFQAVLINRAAGLDYPLWSLKE